MRGVSIYYNAKLGLLKSCHFLKNSIILNFKNLSIAASYFNPKMKGDEIWNELTESFQHIANIDTAIFAGDYNCRLDIKYAKREIIEDFSEYSDLRIINAAPYLPTYVTDNGGKSVVDIILAGKKLKTKEFSIEDTFLRKHQVLKFIFNIPRVDSLKSKTAVSRKICEESLSLKIENELRPQLRQLLINNDINNFYKAILTTANDCRVEPRSFKRKSQPWFDSDCYCFRRDLLFLRHFSTHLTGTENNSPAQIEIANTYREAKKYYRQLCKSKKTQAQERRDQKLIHEAKTHSYKFLRVDSKLNYVANDISLSDWKTNFDRILNEQGLHETGSLSLKEMLTEYPRQENLNYFLEEEAQFALKGMKNNKAPGPDSLCNETLKLFCDPLLSEITAFFNLCLETGDFPDAWKVSDLILLFKGKGDTADTNNFRGISLSCSIYNLLDRMIKNRLYAYLADDIPKNQFGFVRGRSTTQAINQLIAEIKLSVYDSHTPLYSLFLDVKKAFDSIDRKFIFQKLLDTKKLRFEELNLLAEFLEINFLNISDRVGLSESIVQSNGVKQGGSLSPLLFIFSLFDINDLLKDFPHIKLLIYADDIVIISKNLDDIQNFLNRLIAFLAERNLKLNPAKCKILKFRNKGRGRYKATDKLKIDTDDVEFVSDFVYLGVKFQASGLSFTKHIDKRIKAAIFATCKLTSLPKASVDTALKLFDLAISPIASYGIEAIWPYLSLSDLHHLETAKTRFLKKALSLSKFIKSRYTYKLAATGYFIDDLRRKFSLPETDSYNKFITNQTFKNTCIDPQFFDTPAMINPNWKTACFDNRHVFTRFACHGFHYVLCSDKSFHASAHDACKCVNCGEKMDQYHFNKCDKNDMSLIQASKFCWKH